MYNFPFKNTKLGPLIYIFDIGCSFCFTVSFVFTALTSQYYHHWSRGLGWDRGRLQLVLLAGLAQLAVFKCQPSSKDWLVPHWQHLPSNPCLSFQHVCTSIPLLQSTIPLCWEIASIPPTPPNVQCISFKVYFSMHQLLPTSRDPALPEQYRITWSGVIIPDVKLN